MVAELRDSDLWGAMMLQEAPKVVVAMVSLALAYLLICLARSFAKELVNEEETERTVMGE